MKRTVLFYLLTATPFIYAIYLGNNHLISSEIFGILFLFWAFLFRPVVFFYLFKDKAGFQPKNIWNCFNPLWLFQHEVKILFT